MAYHSKRSSNMSQRLSRLRNMKEKGVQANLEVILLAYGFKDWKGYCSLGSDFIRDDACS